jgi:hypothetical protein
VPGRACKIIAVLDENWVDTVSFTHTDNMKSVMGIYCEFDASMTYELLNGFCDVNPAYKVYRSSLQWCVGKTSCTVNMLIWE